VTPVAAPNGHMDPAPVTSLPIHNGEAATQVRAFWTADDQYVLCIEDASGSSAWYRIAAESEERSGDAPATESERLAMGALLADIIPLGGHTVTFPVGSTGRRVYRVWRGAKGHTKSQTKGNVARRTRILGVRAARSRRLPA
jgi:hypothetical protein